jgi:DNA-binding MarR family transcriptional regulator
MPPNDRPAPRSRPAAKRSAAPAAPELVDEPGHLLRRAHQAAVAAFHEAHGRGVTPVQYAVLRALADKPGIDQVTLADAVALDTSTTADIAARLEAKGWIHRELLPRRQRALSLTPDGEAVLRSMLPHVRPMYEALLAPLTEAQREQFVHLLRKLVHT